MCRIILAFFCILFGCLLSLNCSSSNSITDNGGSSVEVIAKVMADHKDRMDQPAKNIRFHVYKLINDDSLSTYYTGNTNDAGECRFIVNMTGMYVIKFAMQSGDYYYEFGTRYFKVETMGTTIDLGTIYLLSTGSISGMLFVNANTLDSLAANVRWRGEGLRGGFTSNVVTRGDSTFLSYSSDRVIPPGRYSVQVEVQGTWRGQNMGYQFGTLIDTVIDLARNQTVVLPTIPLYAALSAAQQKQHFADSLAAVTLCENYGRFYSMYFNTQTGRLECLVLSVAEGVSMQDLRSGLAVLSGLRVLLISGATGDTLPEEICQMKDLETLQLDSCELSVLPDAFENLDDLILLQLTFNRFTKVPPILLDNRWAPIDVHVYFAGNPIVLDPATENLLSCGIFAQSANQTYTINKHFVDLLSEISTADLSIMKEFCAANKIPLTTMPQLYHAAQGRILFIKIPAQYCIDSIPASLAQLDRLYSLIIKRNGLDTIPALLASCKDLRTLEIENGTVRCIAPEIGSLPNLTELNVCNNELTEVPELIRDLYLNQKWSYLPFRADFAANLLMTNASPNEYAHWNCFTMYQKKAKTVHNGEFVGDQQNYESLWRIKEYAGGDLGGRSRFMGNRLVSLRVTLNFWGVGDIAPKLSLFDSLKSIELWGNSNYTHSAEALRFDGDENWIETYPKVEDVMLTIIPGLDTIPDHFFAHFPNVKRVSLRGCDFARVPLALKRLTNLEYVDMYWNRLHGVSPEDRAWLDAHCREHPAAIYSSHGYSGYVGKSWDQAQKVPSDALAVSY